MNKRPIQNLSIAKNGFLKIGDSLIKEQDIAEKILVGPTGPVGADSIVPGPPGSKGERGEAFQVDEFNVQLDDTKLLSIQNTSNASNNDFYVFVVASDNRIDKTTYGLNGDVSKYVIAYNGTNFVSYGQFTGLRGEIGPTGLKGERGESFQVDEFNVQLDDNKLISIENTSNASNNDFYVFVVASDNRSDKTTYGLNGDVSKYVIAYNGTDFVSYGQFTGLQGEIGPTGPFGVNGAQGPTGPTGPQGPQGPSGLNGLEGANGEQGPTGPQGPQGPSGLNGLEGTNGEQGPTGPQGPSGLNGLEGSDGAQGPTGPAGSDGLRGPTGPAGSDGLRGPTGPPGSSVSGTGSIGPTGPAGSVGAVGPTGPTGGQGTQGPTGPAGLNGTDGASDYITDTMNFDTLSVTNFPISITGGFPYKEANDRITYTKTVSNHSGDNSWLNGNYIVRGDSLESYSQYNPEQVFNTNTSHANGSWVPKQYRTPDGPVISATPFSYVDANDQPQQITSDININWISLEMPNPINITSVYTYSPWIRPKNIYLFGEDENNVRRLMGNSKADGSSHTFDVSSNLYTRKLWTVFEGNLNVQDHHYRVSLSRLSFEGTIQGAIDTSMTLSADNNIFLNDVNINKRLFIDGDISWNTTSIADNSIPPSAIIGGVSSNNTTELAAIEGDLTLNNRLFVDNNVGIGITTPEQKLHVNGRVQAKGMVLGNLPRLGGTWAGLYHTRIHDDTYGVGYNTNAYCLMTGENGSLFLNCTTTTNGTAAIYFQANASTKMIVNSSGDVGIGTTNPGKGKVEINGYRNYYITNARYYTNSTGSYSGVTSQNRPTSLYTSHMVATSQLQVFSDERIKKNITEIPDNLSLQILRDLPIKYYNYIDDIERGTNKVIGFIAQEVKAILPNAVAIEKDTIPDEYRLLENFNWTTTEDGMFKLSCDLQNCSGMKYKFKVSNDPEKESEDIVVVANDDDTFTFKNQYSHIFLYGKEVNDFHRLDKAQIFAVGMSALQEIDRQLQAEKSKVALLETENNHLKTQITDTFNRLEQSTNEKINALEQKIAELEKKLSV